MNVQDIPMSDIDLAISKGIHTSDLSWEYTLAYLNFEGILDPNNDIRTRVERLCRYGWNKGPFDRNSIETLCKQYANQRVLEVLTRIEKAASTRTMPEFWRDEIILNTQQEIQAIRKELDTP